MRGVLSERRYGTESLVTSRPGRAAPIVVELAAGSLRASEITAR